MAATAASSGTSAARMGAYDATSSDPISHRVVCSVSLASARNWTKRTIAESSAVMATPASLTGQYLTGFKQIPSPKERRKPTKGRRLTVLGARANNTRVPNKNAPARPSPASHDL